MFSYISPLGILPDVGGGEFMMILLVVLLLFGGDKMPQMAKSFGKSIREFKRAANEVEREIKRAIDEVPDTPDIGTTLREAAAQSRRKHAARIAPKPVAASDAAVASTLAHDPFASPVSPAESAPSAEPTTPSLPHSPVAATEQPADPEPPRTT